MGGIEFSLLLVDEDQLQRGSFIFHRRILILINTIKITVYLVSFFLSLNNMFSSLPDKQLRESLVILGKKRSIKLSLAKMGMKLH